VISQHGQFVIGVVGSRRFGDCPDIFIEVDQFGITVIEQELIGLVELDIAGHMVGRQHMP